MEVLLILADFPCSTFRTASPPTSDSSAGGVEGVEHLNSCVNKALRIFEGLAEGVRVVSLILLLMELLLLLVVVEGEGGTDKEGLGRRLQEN